MTRSENAQHYFKNGFNCSQAVLAAFADDLEMSKDSCLKIACGFGGGMARQQLTCGAVTGAIMALGLKFGKAGNDDDAKKLFTYKKTQALMDEFRKKHNSINCRELLQGLDMDADAAKIKELGLFQTLCPCYVKDAVEITEELLKA
jgi:C_GCAxxG_C_C family probable redox protein